MGQDMGPAALRYQMAAMLEISERMILTEAVSYSFPCNCWCPVKLEEEEFASLMWREEGQEFVLRKNDNEMVLSEGQFLSGRVSVAVRPLCMFDRPGVGVRWREAVYVLMRYDHERHVYKASRRTNEEVDINPDDAEVCCLV